MWIQEKGHTHTPYCRCKEQGSSPNEIEHRIGMEWVCRARVYFNEKTGQPAIRVVGAKASLLSQAKVQYGSKRHNK
jgi:hypothetical protein